MKYNQFESIKNILEKVSGNLNLDRGLKEISLLSTWGEIIGERFKSNTKAISIIDKKKFDVLVVAVASGAISQDLMFFKNDILKKLYKPAKSLGFEIKDIIFNHKIWNEITRPLAEIQEEIGIKIYNEKPTDEELSKIEIPESIINSTKESLQNQSFASDEIKMRIYDLIIKDIKYQIWRKIKGFPSCKNCGISLNYDEKDMLCPSCKFALR
ncbi:MAG: DUF721 domain-containing protein [Candidatus Gastranaerophilales bacterium]|nr:DUF721 domain-containing protein [Candidatus Gastranaerophilales bacterium]